MTPHFVMIWDDMLFSTINEHPPSVWKLFTVCLLRCDADGCFRGTLDSLARLANMELEETESAMAVLSSEDDASTSPDHEGRRIISTGPNQWQVVNYQKYRLRAQAERKKAEARERMRRLRNKDEQDVTDGNESEHERTETNPYIYTSQYTSSSTSNTPKKKRKGASRFTPPTIEEVQAYVQEKGLKVIPSFFVDFYESKGWMVGKNSMKDWRAACRRSENWDEMQFRVRKEEAVAAGKPATDADWMYGTYRFEDLQKYKDHSLWGAYAEAAASYPPRQAPPFMEWLEGQGDE